MTVYMIYISFIIFVIVLIIVSLYFITSLVYRKFNEVKIEQKKKEILSLFEKILSSDNKNMENEIEKLKRSFSGRRGVQSFYLAYVAYVEKNGYSANLRNLLNWVVDYRKIMKSKIVRGSYRKSYTLYLISEFQLNEEEVGEMALDCLEDDSIYVRHNALNVIENQGNIGSVLNSISKINDNEKYYNDKIVIDFLDNFKGDKKKLDSEMLKKLDVYNSGLINIIIEHFINVSNDALEVRDKVLNLLNTAQDHEILIKSTKYFSKVIDERAGEYILRNMDSDNWSLRAESTKTIFKYSNHQVVQKLTQTLSDPNYFVRSNSANSLIQIQEKEEVFEEAWSNKDPFAQDILSYSINASGLSGFEEFKRLKELEENIQVNNQESAGEELDVVWT